MRQFFRTPKGLLTILLVALVAIAAPREGLAIIGPGLLAGIAAAMAIDAPILRWRQEDWEFPSGALLTGLIVAMLLSAREPWYVVAATSAIAVASKYAVRSTSANVFNPAALGLVVTFHLFHTTQDWWGALPNLPLYAVVVLIAAGVFITDRVNKMPLVLAFLGAYFLLFTTAAFAGDEARVEEIFRPPDLHAVLFFAFFILTDPPTSPVRYRAQMICGVLVAVVSVAVFEWIGVVYYLLAGVLAGNVWEALNRVRLRRNRL
jgi:Na+-translocating ferredoxin:NAD+ oxidoreductase RnfD subunit